MKNGLTEIQLNVSLKIFWLDELRLRTTSWVLLRPASDENSLMSDVARLEMLSERSPPTSTTDVYGT